MVECVKYGKATAVLMAPAEYDQLSERARFDALVNQGLNIEYVVSERQNIVKNLDRGDA